ncbi:MAG: tetratricopeptide repeat protein, partial [Gemmatimonadota bacterium]
IHSDLARRIARAIGAALTLSEQDRINATPTENLEAYDFYVLGRDRWMSRRGSANREAIAFYESAISEDPEFALAHAALAQAHVTLAVHVFEGVDLHQEYALAKAAVRRAMELDPDLPEAHAALGLITSGYDWDWDGAEGHFLRAIELNPGDAETRAWYSSLLLALGRPDEANAQAKVAVELDPISYNAVRAFLASATEEDERQVQQTLNRILQARPENPYIRMLIGTFLWQQGRYDEAVDEFMPLLAEEYGFHEPDSLRALLHLAGIPEGQARAGNIIRYMEEQAPGIRTISPFLFLNYGLFEEALAGAEYLVRRRDYGATALGADVWAPLYSDPRYLALLDEVGLPHPQIRGLDGG